MSSQPDDETVYTLEDAPALPAPVEERKRDKLLRYTKHGAKLAAVATHRIVTRTVWWGAWGLVVGGAIFGAEWGLGLLAFPWPRAQVFLLVAIGVLLPVAGAGCWGHAGFWRGVGRFVIVLGVDNGWVVSLMTAVLDRMVALLRKSRRIDGLMDRTELWVGDLPLERWETLLKKAAAAIIGETDARSTRMMRWLRAFVVHRIERYLLRIVRKEIANGHGGGVSMQKVREVAFVMAEEQFTDGIVGLMNKQLLTMTGLFALISATPPLAAWLLGWALGA